jgi:hypothetical protein
MFAQALLEERAGGLGGLDVIFTEFAKSGAHCSGDAVHGLALACPHQSDLRGAPSR